MPIHRGHEERQCLVTNLNVQVGGAIPDHLAWAFAVTGKTACEHSRPKQFAKLLGILQVQREHLLEKTCFWVRNKQDDSFETV